MPDDFPSLSGQGPGSIRTLNRIKRLPKLVVTIDPLSHGLNFFCLF